MVSPAEVDGPDAEQEIYLIRALVLSFVLPGSLSWTDNRHFTAKALGDQWPADAATYDVNGEITKVDPSGRPLEILVHNKGFPKGLPSVSVRYTYGEGEPRWFPTDIAISATVFHVRTITQSRHICTVELGSIDLPAEGFTPSAFLEGPTATVQPLVLFVSNHVQGEACLPPVASCRVSKLGETAI